MRSQALVCTLMLPIALLAMSLAPAYADAMDGMAGMDMRKMPSPVPAASPAPSGQPKPTQLPTQPQHDTPIARMPMNMKMDMSALDPTMMPATTDIGAPMTREGSGTSWMPDATRMYGRMWARGNDMEMTHGVLFLRYVDAGSARGDQRIVAPGWWMYMRTHPTSPKGQIGLQVMLTPDVATVGGSGYPELFQTGETWHGRPLHDTQHPHDLVSELAVSYSQRLTPKTSAYLYTGYPGEPALGPPAYMHRALAYDYAPAPIGHHWEDATHITNGVITAGLSGTKMKIEASEFTGREPNEVRTNFDPIHLDSSSARLSWNPNRYIAAQISTGLIKSPESLEPDINLHRTTASVLYERSIDRRRSLSQAVVFGQNADSTGQRTSARLYEADYHLVNTAYFVRAERVTKSGADLVLAPADLSTLYHLTVVTLGLVHDIAHAPGRTVPGVGFDLSYNLKPTNLSADYGPGNPLGFEVFFRLRPSEIGGEVESGARSRLGY